MRISVEGKPNSAFGIWLRVGDVWHGANWKAIGHIRKHILLAAKREYENRRFGAPWLG